MGQIVDDIMIDIKSYSISDIEEWEYIHTRITIDKLLEHLVRPALIKHLEPQKKAEVCQHNFVSTFGNASIICSKCWKSLWLFDTKPQETAINQLNIWDYNIRKQELRTILRRWPKIDIHTADDMIYELNEMLNVYWLSITDINALSIKECC